jgi:glycosyltransferase involved in cell wall biosynthesis
MLHALHVIAGIDPVYGGPSYTVPRLCSALAAAGAQVELLSVAGRDTSPSDLLASGYRDRRFCWDYASAPMLRALRCSRGLVQALRAAAAGGADVIHDHGLWLMPNVQAGHVAADQRRPLVVAPRGMLGPAALAFSPRKKRMFWRLLQGPAVRSAACLHATSQQEYEEIRAFGLRNPVTVIPNGIDLPQPAAEPSGSNPPHRVVLSLGRVHPKKGLDRLVHAWAQIEAAHARWRLRIIGPSEVGHDKELRALAEALGATRVSIEAPVYDASKTAAYREADVFVLPTLNENFAITVAEALASGTPVIATKGAPWSGLDARGCGWWIDHGVETLAAALAHAMSLPPETLRAMGAKGRAWMARDYSWDRIARDMLDVYCWLVRGNEIPESVRLD